MNYMYSSDINKISREWEKYKGYTVRPLPSTIAYYETVLNQFNHYHQFLLYGGTPEIRSLFQQRNYGLTLLDKSEAMVKAMGLLSQQKLMLAPNEQFLQSDWLNPNYTTSSWFDLILGDDAINMVEWNQYEAFLKNTHRLLKNNGLFLCHLLIKPDDELVNQTILEIEEEYKHGLIKSKFDLASRLNFLCYDYQTFKMGWQQTINSLGKNLELFKPDFDFEKIFGLCNSQFYCPPQDQFESLLTPYFTIEEIFYPGEYAYCRFEPVYLLRKKLCN